MTRLILRLWPAARFVSEPDELGDCDRGRISEGVQLV